MIGSFLAEFEYWCMYLYFRVSTRSRYLCDNVSFSSGYMPKRQSMKPRLGRGNTWTDDDDKMVKTPPFSPRLGRRSLVPLKPRLGRANTSPETAVFKPRLGRDPNFNDFNEYTDTRNSPVDDKDH